jgi:hypothetical protein
MYLAKKEDEESMGDLQYKRSDCDLAMKSIDTVSFHQKF